MRGSVFLLSRHPTIPANTKWPTYADYVQYIHLMDRQAFRFKAAWCGAPESQTNICL